MNNLDFPKNFWPIRRFELLQIIALFKGELERSQWSGSLSLQNQLKNE